MSFEAQLTGFGYGGSMTGEGWPDYVTLDNGGILSIEYETRAYYPVDRDALLALAGVMQGQQYMREDARFLRWDEAARRIREACGATKDGSNEIGE